MSETNRVPRFQWTEQTLRYAELLAALGYRQSEIALRLNCHRSTINKHFGPVQGVSELSLPDLARLFERYDTERNIDEVLSAIGGSTEQARLRASLRARLAATTSIQSNEAEASEETLSDAQLCAEVERLVGRPIQIEHET